MVANQKGGVGKTTCVIEICNAFSRMGYKVLGIDTDPQNSFSKLSNADIESPNNLKAVLDMKIHPNDAIQHLERFDIIPGSEDLAGSSLYGETNDAWLLAEAIEAITEDYDFIIMDSGPGRSRLLEMEYIAADYVLAPTTPDTESESGLFKLKKDLIAFTKHGQSHALLLGVYMNRFKRATNIHRSMYNNLINIQDELGTTVFKSTIRDTVKAEETRLFRTSLNDMDKKSRVAEDFNRLIEEIIVKIKEKEKEV